MIPEPYVAAAGATSAEVALLMRAKDISVVPVVDNPKDRRYLGTISDRDIVTGCVAAGHDPKTCKVQTHARQDTEVVTLDTELEGYRIERLDKRTRTFDRPSWWWTEINEWWGLFRIRSSFRALS